uniref:Uncharacterized protein n=1 Tax=Triticum urartu TaxID=4572 RepID=A0A8R7U097_TRIUA
MVYTVQYTSILRSDSRPWLLRPSARGRRRRLDLLPPAAISSAETRSGLVSASSLGCAPSPLQALKLMPMVLASASSSLTPSAASSAAAAMAAAALASRKAAPAAGGRLSRAGSGLPPRPSVAASPAAHPPLPGVAALSTLGVACAAPDPRAPGLMDGGLGSQSPPRLGCLLSCAVQSTPTPTVVVGAPSLSTTGAATSFLVPAEAPPSPPAATAEAPSTTAACCATSPTT